MSGQSFDLVVLGGGSGGLAASFRAASHGAKVAMLEPALLGGTCVNVGCVPKKAMWLAADLAERIALASALGFDVPAAPRLSWPRLLQRRQQYIDGIHASYRQRLQDSGVVHIAQRGRLRDARTVECEDGTRLHAGHIVIATGSHALKPDLPGAGLGGISDDFFALRAAPARVAIVGGGYIAVELAGVLHGLGSEVTLLVRGKELLSQFDAEMTAQLVQNLRQQGITVRFGCQLQALERRAGGIHARLRDGAADALFDTVLFATGRAPSTRGLGLETAGVALDDNGAIVVDAFQDTSVPGISAIGDVTAQAMLTPVAVAAARRLMDRLYGGAAGLRQHPQRGVLAPAAGQRRLERGAGTRALRHRHHVPQPLPADAAGARRGPDPFAVQDGLRRRGREGRRHPPAGRGRRRDPAGLRGGAQGRGDPPADGRHRGDPPDLGRGSGADALSAPQAG